MVEEKQRKKARWRKEEQRKGGKKLRKRERERGDGEMEEEEGKEWVRRKERKKDLEKMCWRKVGKETGRK